jgi:hypothetical protein
MPKATVGGVSNQIVDPDYIAPAGVAPEVGLETGEPDMGLPDDEKEAEKVLKEREERREAERQEVADGQNTGISDSEKLQGGDPPVEQEGEQSSSPDSTSSPDSQKREHSQKKTSGAGSTPLNVPNTGGRSQSGKGSSTASSGDTK